MNFKLPELNYAYDSLEPYIDAKTMEIQHSKHHAGYTNNLNNAINGTEFQNQNIEEILRSEDLPAAIRNNGGGLLDQAVKMVDLFINSRDTILYTKGKLKNVNEAYYATKTLYDKSYE